ncbi:hypothetical protein FKM82_006137 [Ascaphus truei]
MPYFGVLPLVPDGGYFGLKSSLILTHQLLPNCLVDSWHDVLDVLLLILDSDDHDVQSLCIKEKIFNEHLTLLTCFYVSMC